MENLRRGFLSFVHCLSPRECCLPLRRQRDWCRPPSGRLFRQHRSICTGGSTNRGLAQRWMRRSGSIRRV